MHNYGISGPILQNLESYQSLGSGIKYILGIVLRFLVIVFSGVILSNIMFKQVAFTGKVIKKPVSKNWILLYFYRACAITIK